MEDLFAKAREISWRNFGKRIIFYHPGMFRCNGEWGRYPAISITGKNCELGCAHCKAKILETMIFATSPKELIEKCIQLDAKDNIGCLLTGGSFKDGSLPWEDFISAIREIKRKTRLIISIHSGLIDFITAEKLKSAGVDQALIDVIGEDETFQKIYNVKFGVNRIEESMEALEKAGIPIVPHIVVGIDYGKIKGEYKAIEMIRRHNPYLVVIVVLMPLLGTLMENVSPPPPREVAKVMAWARISLPNVPLSLGCARARGKSEIDVLAIECGINRIALGGEEAIRKAKEYGLEIEFQKTCCSIPYMCR
jgi:hypothetical protein